MWQDDYAMLGLPVSAPTRAWDGERGGQGVFTEGGVEMGADNSWGAMEGGKAVQVEWEPGRHASESSETLRQQFLENAGKPGKIVRNDGDGDTIIATAGKKV